MKLTEAQRHVLSKSLEDNDPDGTVFGGRYSRTIDALSAAGLVDYWGYSSGGDGRWRFRVFPTPAGRAALQNTQGD